MRCAELVVVAGPAPGVLPAFPWPGHVREGRPLYVLAANLEFHTRFGIQRVPAGYITDFASIPRLAAWRIRPLDAHAWAAVLHDWRYAVGEPGKRQVADAMFRERLDLDVRSRLRREVMHRAVQLGGAGGYAKAPTWWATENFADPRNGIRTAPPFAREAAFDGARFGLQPGANP